MNNVALLCCIPAVVIAAFMAPHLEPYTIVEDDYTQTEMQAAKDSIALSLMGQLQFTVGDLLWMKSQEYLHGGLVYRMPTKAEEQMGYLPTNATDVAAGLSHSEGVLMSPEAQHDWRGILGRIDREVIPHADHRHADPVELIPWYQLVVKMNPHQERVYSMGAFFMSDSATAPGDALEFLHKGLTANPWSWELRGGIGRILHDYANRTEELAIRKGHSEPVLDETIPTSEEEAYSMAAEILAEASQFGLEDRVKLAERREVFDDYQKQLFRESYLMLAKSLTELERWDEALEACAIGYDVTKHNHLRVQERTIKRAMEEKGLTPPESSIERVDAIPKSNAHNHSHKDVIQQKLKERQKEEEEFVHEQERKPFQNIRNSPIVKELMEEKKTQEEAQ